ncbi:hypothetical protein [Achromobacter insolitus]|uniref:hypothetical protein n=1 Tax=Achromobacter insolitus TaxID=217204 RepID=UPI0007C20FC1|nr:hypothetical protein [Achromobacter insolitus]OAD16489.1 hypothetical protein A3839_28480 [Achromobacter insolitus]
MTENNAAQAAGESSFPEQAKFDRLYNRTFKGYGLDAERLAHAELFWKEGHRLALLSKPRAPVSALSAETLRLTGVIADKIEDGTLFQAGIFSRRELAHKVRAVMRFAQQSAHVTDERAAPVPLCHIRPVGDGWQVCPSTHPDARAVSPIDALDDSDRQQRDRDQGQELDR